MKQNDLLLEKVKFIYANIEHMDFIYQSLFDMAVEERVSSRFTKTKEELEQIIFKDNQAVIFTLFPPLGVKVSEKL